MRLDLNQASPVPLFRQIADEIQRRIAVGILKADEALPAVRTLATEAGVNANTVQHAYRTLEQEGVVHVRRGLGTFVTPRRPEGKARVASRSREIAERMLREGYRHGLLASDLIAALHEIAPRIDSGRGRSSGPGGEEEV
jgi:GntR family transcriptional regulator